MDNDYISWIKEIKAKIYRLQIKASIAVNVELLSFYWDLGQDLNEKQTNKNWGDAVIEQLSKDLHSEFPEIKGFSRSNLFYIKKWHLFYSEQIKIIQQAVGQITLPANIDTLEKIQQLVGQIPWGHNILIITKIKDINEAIFYVNETLINGWSRAILRMQIETDLYSRQGKATTNFIATLP